MTALVASTRAELLRLRKWPATWVMVGAWLLLNIMFVYAFNYISYRTGDASNMTDGIPPRQLLAEMLPSAVPTAAIQGMPMFGGAILLILGGLVVGSGYGWGTWKTVFTQGPGRLATFGGTLAALAVAVAGVVALTFVVDFGIAAGVAATESVPIEWPALADIAQGFGSGLLILGMWTAAGVLVGTLARSPALAVGLGLVWALAVENLLRSVAGALDGLSYVTDVLPGTAAGSLVGALVGRGGGEDGTPGVLTVLDGGTAAAWLATYLVVFVGVATYLVRRRDLT